MVAFPVRARTGFTLIELLVVMAVIAILAMVAVPPMQDRLARQQVVEAMKLADIAKGPIATTWSLTQTLPADNAAAGLPVPDKIVSNYVKAVLVENGAIHVTFGNKAMGGISGRTLTLRPAVVEDAKVVPVAWVCGDATPPDKMTLHGANRTDLPKTFLPLNCRVG